MIGHDLGFGGHGPARCSFGRNTWFFIEACAWGGRGIPCYEKVENRDDLKTIIFLKWKTGRVGNHDVSGGGGT